MLIRNSSLPQICRKSNQLISSCGKLSLVNFIVLNRTTHSLILLGSLDLTHYMDRMRIHSSLTTSLTLPYNNKAETTCGVKEVSSSPKGLPTSWSLQCEHNVGLLHRERPLPFSETLRQLQDGQAQGLCGIVALYRQHRIKWELKRSSYIYNHLPCRQD